MRALCLIVRAVLCFGSLQACMPTLHHDESAAPPLTSEVGASEDTARQPIFGSSGGRILSFVAHQDDDLFAMSPDLLHDVRAGKAVQSVVFTAGDASLCQQYVVDRGIGQKRGFEVMAGVDLAGDWGAPELRVVAGHTVLVETMPGRDISLVYLGLSNNDRRDLEQLWNDRTGSLAAPRQDERLPAGQTYTREALIQLVTQLIVDFSPTHINTLDSGKTWPLISYPSEHTDHVHSALFALAGLQRIAPAPAATVRLYRTYNAIAEVENVSAADVQDKHRVYEAYAAHDPYLCEGVFSRICGRLTECQNPAHVIYGAFEPRQYPIATQRGVSGVLRAPGGACLGIEGNAAPGSELAAVRCGSAAQTFSLPADGTLQTSGLCVSASTGNDLPSASARGAVLRLEACESGATRQQFLLSGTSQLRGPDATCVSAADPAALRLAECSDAADVVGYTLGFRTEAFVDSEAAQFADDGTPGQALAYGDLDGDGDADVCVRRGDGVYCGFHAGAPAFTALELQSAAFGDGAGYGSADTGGTLQLADINGDGAADLCARARDGIWCADNLSGGTSFGLPVKRSAGADFSDRAGVQLGAQYYGSIRLVDIDADGLADVCARNASGIGCARNGGAPDFTLEPQVQRENVEFTDALGWFVPAAGSTLQYADVDGDGLVDVCGRGAGGLRCMLGTGLTGANRGFERAHVWSDTGDFSDLEGWRSSDAYYGSIRLGDIDGDARADVCGRGARGVVCAISTGQAFATAREMLPSDPFRDARYGDPRAGASLALLHFDDDTRADLYLRGPVAHGSSSGLLCTLAP